MPATMKEIINAILQSKVADPAAAIVDLLETSAFAQLQLTDGITAPVAVSGKAQIYVDAADGDLKVRFGDNVTKTLATDT